MMANAWERGISTHEFRKCWSEDLKIISEIKQILKKISKENIAEEAHKRKIQDLMGKLKKW